MGYMHLPDRFNSPFFMSVVCVVVGGACGWIHAHLCAHTEGAASRDWSSSTLFLRHGLSCYFWAAYSWLASP